MGTEGITITLKQREDVEGQLRRTDLTRRVRERLEMVKAAALGDTMERIARWSGRSVETVEHWLTRFAEGGVGALADAPRWGRPVQADEAYLAATESALETPPKQLGLAFDTWTCERLRAYLEQRTGVQLSPGWLRALLGERGWVCGRPKHPLKHLQDPAAVTASRAELGAVGEKGAGRAGALRAALAGPDASRTHSPLSSDVASQGQTADVARRRDPSARHGVRAASKRWDGVESSGYGRPKTAPGSCALWSCWTAISRRCSGTSLWCSITGRRTPAHSACTRSPCGGTGCTSSGGPRTPRSSIPKNASGALSSGMHARIWGRRCATSSMASAAACATSVVSSPPSSTRCRNGSWMATASRPRVAQPAVPLGPRTRTSGHHIDGSTTYPQILSERAARSPLRFRHGDEAPRRPQATSRPCSS
jgi:transposase